jgi:hypothetical protein
MPARPNLSRRRVPIAVAIACTVASAALMVAGCGSSSKPRSRNKSASNLGAAGIGFASCIRAHGVPNFPGPTRTSPSTPAGYSDVLTRNGVSFAIPTTIDIQSPAVQQAATACHLGGLGQGAIG